MSQSSEEDKEGLRANPKNSPDRWSLWDKRVRDLLLFLFGGVGFFHELLIRQEPNLTIILASGALMGVPLILSADEKKKNSR